MVVDTDGNLEPMLPWLLESGIEGVLPLERQAGVDVNRIKKQYPQLFVLGGYDKTVSYTHLDVYKRQIRDGVLLCIHKSQLVYNFKKLHTNRRGPFSNGPQET